jgi:phospholipid-transporting ATPase
MQNAKKPERKVSQVMRLMNKMLYTVFAFQIILVIAFASVAIDWTLVSQAKHTYLSL